MPKTSISLSILWKAIWRLENRLCGRLGPHSRSIYHILIFYLTPAVTQMWFGKIGKHCQIWDVILLGSVQWHRFYSDPTSLSIPVTLASKRPKKFRWLHHDRKTTPCSNVQKRLKRIVRWFHLLCFVPHRSLHKAPSPHQISLGLPKMGQQSCQPFALNCCSLVHLASTAKKVISQWRKTNRLASESHVTSRLLLEQNWN